MFCNTGCTAANAAAMLAEADGACVGTAFKRDGTFQNYVEYKRVKEFMDVVKDFRASL